MFCFYTNLSNLLVLVYELALAIAAGLPHSAALRLLTAVPSASPWRCASS